MFVFNITLSVSFRVCDNISLGARAPSPANTPSGVEDFWPNNCSRCALIAGEGARAPSEMRRASVKLIAAVSNCVEEQWIGRQRLTTVLRPKAEENYPAFA